MAAARRRALEARDERRVKIEELARASIRNLKPYKPGKPIDELKRELGLSDVCKLASNENALGTPEVAVRAIERAARDLWLYPDGSCHDLKTAVAKRHGVAPERVFLGNGSDEILVLLANAFLEPGDNAVTSEWSFVRYDQAVTIAGGEVRKAPMRDFRYHLDAMAALVDARTRLVFLANPNNPTGTIFRAVEARAFLKRLPETCIAVFDEAYHDYVAHPEYPDSLALQAEFADRPILTARSFSKVYGLAGLRVGYGIANHPDIVKYLNAVRGPFNVNALAQAAGVACLEASDHPARSRDFCATERARLAAAFDRLGVRHVPSEANFVLFDCGMDAAEFGDRLLREGVIVRQMKDWGLPPSMVRVSIGRPEENDRFVATLQKVRS